MGQGIRLETGTEGGLGFTLETDVQNLFREIFYQNIVGLALTDRQGKILVSNQSFTVNVLQTSSCTDLSTFVGFLPVTENKQSKAITIIVPSLPDTIKLSCICLQKGPGTAAYLWVANASVMPDANEQLLVLKDLYRSPSTLELTFQTTQTGCLRYANNIFLKSFGFESFQHAKDIAISDLFERIEDYQLIMDRILKGKRIVHETFHFRTIDGQLLVGLVNCQFHKKEDECMLNWTVLDISQPIEFDACSDAESALMQNVDDEVNKFIFSTFHDFKYPLTSIMGLADLIRMETKDQVLTDYIEKIETSASRLDRIIRDLTGFSRTFQQQKKWESINLEKLVWDQVSRYSQDPNFKNIHFEVSASQHFPFYTDQECLEIILDNIIRNAVHFYDRNKIRPFVRINIVTGAKEILIEVMDNGIGIDKANQAQVFNMFYKATSQSRGVGLGLYIVREGLQQLKGTITLESEIGFGSVFRIRIPNENVLMC